jgi:hypothetical protein
MAKRFQFAYLMELCLLGKIVRKREIFIVVVPFAGDRQVADTCLRLITSMQQPIRDVLCKG